MIPLTDLKRQHQALAELVEPRVLELLRSQEFILGKPVRDFEDAVKDYLGCEAAVGVSSASDGLYLALLDAGVGPGDEVITTPLTFVATAEAILRVGATPVFADIEPDQLALSVESVQRALSPRVRAVISVHLFGHVGRISELAAFCRAERLTLVEDVAQAFGAREGERCAGNFGDYGVFSFFPAKVLGGAGDGGLIVTSEERAARLRRLRVHGHDGQGAFMSLGGNYRLDALQATILGVKLGHIERFIACRREAASRYASLLAPVSSSLRLPAERPGTRSVWANYVIQVDEPARVAALLHAEGVASARYYHRPLHHQPCFVGRQRSQELPLAEKLAQHLLALPLFPELTAEEQQDVATALAKALR